MTVFKDFSNIEHSVHYVELPLTVKGTVIPGVDGSFDIYINSLLSKEEQEKTYLHELRHIAYEHFYKDNSVIDAEKQASENPIPKEKINITVPVIKKLNYKSGLILPETEDTVTAFAEDTNSDYFAYEVPDSSMDSADSSAIKKGAYILLRSCTFYKDKDLVLCYADGNTFFRQIIKGKSGVVLMPLNNRYNSVFFSDSKKVSVFAVFDSII